MVSKDAYFPFGKRIEGLSVNTSDPQDRYKYNGKELDRENDLNWLVPPRREARYYAPEVCRWHACPPSAMPKLGLNEGRKPRGARRRRVVDPADQFFSSYLAMANSPVKFIDPDGTETGFETEKAANEYANDYNNKLFDLTGDEAAKNAISVVPATKDIRGENGEKLNYVLVKTEGNNFNWKYDKVTAALEETIVTKSVIYFVVENYERAVNSGGDDTHWTSVGNFFSTDYKIGTVYIDPAGWKGSIATSDKFMLSLHAILGHGHPVGNSFKNGAVGIDNWFGSARHAPDHKGTYWEILNWWERTNWYRFPGANYKKREKLKW